MYTPKSTPCIAALIALSLPAAAAAPQQLSQAENAVAGFLLLVVGLTSLVALELLVLALLPGPVERARAEVVRRSGRCFLAGVVALLLGFGLVAVLSKAGGVGGLLAVLIAAALVLGIVLGLPGIGLLAGQTVLQMAGRSASGLAAAVWGLALIFVASLFPVLGQALFVFLCLTALGAVTLALLGGRRGRLLPDLESAGTEGEPEL